MCIQRLALHGGGADISRVAQKRAMWELWGGSIVKACYYFVASPGHCGNSISKRREEREAVCESRKTLLFHPAHTLRNVRYDSVSHPALNLLVYAIYLEHTHKQNYNHNRGHSKHMSDMTHFCRAKGVFLLDAHPHTLHCVTVYTDT